MLVDLLRIQRGNESKPPSFQTKQKKPGPEDGPGKCWLVARIKIEAFSRRERAALSGEWEPAAEILRLRFSQSEDLPRSLYAVLLGLTVKSRTWVRMLDICIPFSCETKGSNSETNGSFINSITSSWRVRSPPLSKSGTVTSSARASRSRDDSVGVAFSFSIFDTYVRGTDILPASCRWLSPFRRRSERIDVARFKCPRPVPGTGIITGGAIIIGAGSGSSSMDAWHLRQLLLDVRN